MFIRKKARFWLLCLAVIIVLGLALLAIYLWNFESIQHLWNWAGKIHPEKESGSATIRNLGLIALAMIALPFAIWRSIVAHRQADTAQQSLLIQQYQKGAEMLESDILSARLGGINVLKRLANQHPEEYHIDVMSLFCSFARDPNRGKGYRIQQKSDQDQETEGTVGGHVSCTRIREDVQAIMEIIGDRSQKQRDVEIDHRFSIHLEDADLRGLRLRNAVLSAVSYDSNEVDRCRVCLNRADLSDAILDGVTLSGPSIFLEDVNMSGAKITGCDISEAFLNGIILSDAELRRINLRDAKLEKAVLRTARFWSVDLTKAALNGAKLCGLHCYFDVNLSYAQFSAAYLCRADLRGADVRNAYVDGAYLSGTIFSQGGDMKVKNLTQRQLDEAKHDSSSAPILINLIDPQTKEPLKWRGKN